MGQNRNCNPKGDQRNQAQLMYENGLVSDFVFSVPVLNPNPDSWRDLGPELIWVTGPVPFVKFKLYTNPDPYPYKRPRVKPKLNPNT